jgi:hypothetical protein
MPTQSGWVTASKAITPKIAGKQRDRRVATGCRRPSRALSDAAGGTLRGSPASMFIYLFEPERAHAEAIVVKEISDEGFLSCSLFCTPVSIYLCFGGLGFRNILLPGVLDILQ